MLSKTIIKYIQSLIDKKVRDNDGVFIAEGPKVIEDFLASNKFSCKMICALPEWFDENKQLLKNVLNENLIEVTDFELEKISALQTPNKVLAVLYKKEEAAIDVTNSITLMLDGIQDPGNLGTIIRTADWFGIKNILCSLGCADCYNPKVVQSTMGSLARINIGYTDLVDFLKRNKPKNIYAATLSGKNIYELEKIARGIFIIGNESKGVSPALLKLTTQQITIPKIGEAESLNAAVATGIILAEIMK